MRLSFLTSAVSSAAALVLALGVAGCAGAKGDDGKGDDDEGKSGDGDDARGAESLKIEIEADTSELAKERASLDAKRKELEGELGDLEDARAKLIAAAGDGSGPGEGKGKGKGKGASTDALAKELVVLMEREKALREKEASYRAERDALDAKKDKVIAKAAGGLATPSGGGGPGAGGGGAGAGATGAGGAGHDDLVKREKKMADREADLARREKAIAEREAALAEREAKVGGGGVSMITRIEVPAGTTYTKKNVDAAYARAKGLMKKKGILPSDLPAGADTLAEQIDAAIAKEDWTTAKVVADTLADTVEKMKIDKAFVSAKIARLSDYLKKKKITPDDGTIWPMFTQATKDFTDGKFGSANVQINAIYGAVK